MSFFTKKEMICPNDIVECVSSAPVLKVWFSHRAAISPANIAAAPQQVFSFEEYRRSAFGMRKAH